MEQLASDMRRIIFNKVLSVLPTMCLTSLAPAFAWKLYRLRYNYRRCIAGFAAVHSQVIGVFVQALVFWGHFGPEQEERALSGQTRI